MNRPRVAITMGDAAGIGPEITVRSLADPRASEWCVPFVIGDARILEKAMAVAGTSLAIRRIGSVADAVGAAGTIDVLDDAAIDPATHEWGRLDPDYGDAAVRWTKEAGTLALAGDIDAMVSAPLNKEAMHEAGHAFEGQTEILGDMTGSKPAMVMVVDRMRLMLFTNHMALRAVCEYLRTDRVLNRLVLADAALRDMGIAKPSIAVAALNPHAGEQGAFGREELDAIIPAIEAAQARGIDARGPVPCRHRVPQVARGRVRHDARAVPRSGADGGQAGGLRSRGHAADRPASHPHVDGPRNGLRHRYLAIM